MIQLAVRGTKADTLWSMKPAIKSGVDIAADPKLSPGTCLRCRAFTSSRETVRGLQNAQQHGGSNRTDRRNLAKPLPGLVFLALNQQLQPHLLAHRPQRIELWVVKFGRCTPGSVIFPSHSARWRGT